MSETIESNSVVKLDSGIIYRLSENNGIAFSLSADLGQHFSEQVYISDTTEECSNPNLLIRNGQLIAFWNAGTALFASTSYDKGASWSVPEEITAFDRLPAGLDMSVNPVNGNFQMLFWNAKGEMMFAYSPDGKSFTAPVTINLGAPLEGIPSISSSGDYVCAAWQSGDSKNIIYAESYNYGQTWTGPKDMNNSRSYSQKPRLKTRNGTVFAVWTDPVPGNNTVYFSTKTFGSNSWQQPGIIASTTDQITDMDLRTPWDNIVFAGYKTGNAFFLTRAFTDDMKWFPVKKYMLSDNCRYFDLIPRTGGITIRLSSSSFFNIENSPPSQPSSLMPDNFLTNSNLLNIKYAQSYDNDGGYIIYRLCLNQDQTKLDPASYTTRDATFTDKAQLPDGQYFYKISAWDGISTSESKISSFTVKYLANPGAPVITATKPSPSDWFKAGTSFAFEAKVNDPGNVLADETEPDVAVNGTTVESSLIYSKPDAKISGFICLPGNILNGTNILKITVKDLRSNVTQTSVPFNVDTIPPAAAAPGNGGCYYSNNKNGIPFSITDVGSGPDNKISVITVYKNTVTIEGNCVPSDKPDTVVFNPLAQLNDGLYTVTITPKDLAGNVGTKQSFPLIIDTVMPVLTLDNTPSCETPDTALHISGSVDKHNISSVKATRNSKTLNEITVNNGLFSGDIPLESGSNNILISVQDPAGNTASTSFSVVCSGSVFSGSSAVSPLEITSLLPCPNPCNPSSQSLKLTYTISKPAAVKFYIFDCGGRLIWTGSGNANAGYNDGLSWNGITAGGENANNGVYLLKMTASDTGGGSAQAKSKIIVLR